MLGLATSTLGVGSPQLQLVHIASNEAIVLRFPDRKNDSVLMSARGIGGERTEHPERPSVSAICAGGDCDLRRLTGGGEIRSLKLDTADDD
jgi:hypothetical protein